MVQCSIKSNIKYCTYRSWRESACSLEHSLTHLLPLSHTEKSQDRLQMFGGVTALSNLLKDLVKQADTMDQLYEDKLEDLLAFISHVIQTISEATHGNGK